MLIYFAVPNGSSLFAQCDEMKENFSHENWGEPVLRGSPVLIPEITLRITKRDSSAGLAGAKVYLRYIWEHFILPYKDSPRGEWKSAYDVIICTANKDGMVQFPEYNFVPRGWYKGPETNKRVPRFIDLELSVEMDHFWITQKQIKEIRDKKQKRPIELKRPDGFVPPIKVEIIPQ